MRKEGSKINCSIFQKQMLIVRNITNAINRSKSVQEKAKFAEELQEEADVLLSCPDYDGDSFNCKICHSISSLRKRTASIIIKAKKLA